MIESAYPWARAARLPGRQLLARRSHETHEEIHKRAVAKRDTRAAVLYGDPARGQSSYANSTVYTADKVPNRKARRSKPRVR